MKVGAYVLAGLAITGLTVALWFVARPFRARPRPPAAVSAARYERLAPVIAVAIGALVVVLVAGLLVAAVT